MGSKCYSWNRLRRRLHRPHFLPGYELWRLLLLKKFFNSHQSVDSVKVYYNDPDFNTETFRRLPEGAKAATALHIWLRSVVEASERIKIFIPGYQNKASAWRESEVDRVDSESSDDEVLEKELVNRYVSHSVLRCPIVRPRPCSMRTCHPVMSRRRIFQNIMQMLPSALQG